ncbi:MAG: prepilin-type N-terminal cleavage/methylation domain-containing protein [Marinospirillum sp.]|uniref:prepilin-type N-terminal cleavage/methylation domain-containing protein n=1 Tax=Marinospirillum sp. TaxID=2183934 RepID=UPI001A001431|nr:prepilin-type N-terminal cleavage/methylation domain-containing protein [Marinospirillum sp.]MBE0506552.1 prepilin-type N-terminal cleavage/methylation domain-containing protein [Marinospirillum sp.]
MHKIRGFTLLEVLLVSLLGSLLLLAATELLASLSQQQARNYAQLRLQDKARLADLAISRDITTATAVLAVGAASQPYPNRSVTSVDLGGFDLAATGFNQFRSSDWLFMKKGNNSEPDYSLWHLDEKTHGFGLAHKGLSRENSDSLTASQTLVDQVELLRFRFYCSDQKRWLTASEATIYSSITHVHFAFLLTSPVSIKAKSRSIELWDEILQPPDDGHLRLLVTGIRALREEEDE